ncbi:hypothetical protein [Sorangium sp. So ce128]|uniref:hypothetical protein n=1 Tax=Sorangium sp. So ce128 TaxID=3133281 RepID=UPI003F5F0616
MMKIDRLWFAMLAAALAGCASETGELEGPGALGTEELLTSESPLTSGFAGQLSNLVARWRLNGTTICSAVVIPDSVGPTIDTGWAITASHCVVDTDPTLYSVVTNNGFPSNVDKLYWHPIAESNLGTVNNYGSVDIVFARLAGPSPLIADVSFQMLRANRDVFQESARMNGTWTFSRDTGHVSPDPTYESRILVDGITSEPGDSGGPIWYSADPNNGSTLEGIHLGSGHAIHTSSFGEWLLNAMACGPFDTSEPDTGFCTPQCKCGAGEGDCDSDADCKAGLVCGQNIGDLVGLPASYDLCVEPGTRQSSSTSGYCASVGGCQLYEGDCDTHDDCRDDLVCRPDVGFAIGEPNWVDVCDLPRMPGTKAYNDSKDPVSGRCTVDEPCALGDGDCNPSNHATCRGNLKCKENVGQQFGFPGNDVDVCVHPDFY